MQSNVIDTSRFGLIQSAFRKVFKGRSQPNIELAGWKAVAYLRHFQNRDIDEFRAKYGKDEGEAKFFHDYEPSYSRVIQHNLFMFNGAALLFQAAINTGTTVANTGFPTPTLLTNANAYLYVSDGAPTAITGTCSINNGSASLTTSSGSSGLSIGVQLVITGDTSSQVYTVTAGSGTSWTISPAFGGTNISGAAAGYFAAPSHSNTTFPGSTNIANQVADSTFPSNPSAALFNAITGATGTPIVLTVSGADINANDIAHVVEVGGDTTANGVWVCNPASSGLITLVGSVAGSSYTSGGYITKRSVLTMQSTFGATAAVFQWNAWGLTNGNGSNKILLNWRAIGMGTKASGTSTALKVGLAIG